MHINAGVSGLVACLVLGKRLGYGREPMSPHNLTFAMLGAAILWIGWFGFNGGSGLAANERAVMAILVTQIAAAAAGVSLDARRMDASRPSLASGPDFGRRRRPRGHHARLGFVGPVAALVMGLIGGVFVALGVRSSSSAWRAGTTRSMHSACTAWAASSAPSSPASSPRAPSRARNESRMTQVGIQAASVVATMVYASAVSWILLKIIDVVMGLRVTSDEERMGLDLSLHGERIE